MEDVKKVHLVVSRELQEKLKSIKIYPRETFGDVVGRLVQEYLEIDEEHKKQVQEHGKGVGPDLQEEEIKLSPEEEHLVKPTDSTNASEGY